METTSKKCLIIGAAGGIGSALVARLSAAGRHLVLAGRREASLAELAVEFASEIAILDAADFDTMAGVFSDNPGINGAVNLAGSILLKPAHRASSPEFDQTIDLNLRTAFSLVQAAGGAMRSTGGSVVLMSTCAASTGLVNHEAISAAKAGVEGLARSAAATYATQGVRFNVIAPGLVDTPLSAGVTGNTTALEASRIMHPLRRIGAADEVARSVAFLLEPDSSWITGNVLGVDGGLARVRGR